MDAICSGGRRWGDGGGVIYIQAGGGGVMGYGGRRVH